MKKLGESQITAAALLIGGQKFIQKGVNNVYNIRVFNMVYVGKPYGILPALACGTAYIPSDGIYISDDGTYAGNLGTVCTEYTGRGNEKSE